MRLHGPSLTFPGIAAGLASHPPVEISSSGMTSAAVALILREGREGLEVLFIERASHDGDPWSGDLGFPGGKIEPGDAGPRGAAERETREELGIDLATAHYLGRLADVAGAHLPIRVSCFVYGLIGNPPLTPGGEVRDAFWVSLTDLCDPDRHKDATVRFGGETFERPAIILPAEGKPALWGITYRLVMQFLALVTGEGVP
ncbi:NUDIX hydrolase [Geobacter grbiciae]|uniref:NUDIX hydrolase, coenzyme A pyrophosphatase family n=2 Tax=Geobacter metallireducens TaxID=28232 RepID=Q39Z14_GEOMG|nr:CoA pyrophosphatase [Geobacter grbiciae]ABB30510.1 NUDIX hydrolase, coenzyme A pyrophosphatase family [Geobacter metallireducens GS-15]MBT1076819.1 CoA pyrophosphatase [Geobacter grbiciae]